MNRDEVIKFVRENEVFFLATSDDGKPRVRGMNLFLVNNTGLYFCMGKLKEVYTQLKTDPKVEMCFYNEEQMIQVRLRGTVAEFDDDELKKMAMNKFPFLRPVAEVQGYEAFAVFGLTKGQSATWTVRSETSGEEPSFVPF